MQAQLVLNTDSGGSRGETWGASPPHPPLGQGLAQPLREKM